MRKTAASRYSSCQMTTSCLGTGSRKRDTMSLSDDVPSWVPRSEAELAMAAGQGVLEESHYLDVKREITAGRNANKELARDIASFAVDGGLLIIGISEDVRANSLSLAPQPLAGLAERIEMVARTAADPPLAVLCSPIRSEQDPSLGYLVVRVPPSAMAPHMVDHRYLGRGDKTKLYLSDADVRQQAHLFLLALPSAARPGMLLGLVHGQGVQVGLLEFARRADSAEIREL